MNVNVNVIKHYAENGVTHKYFLMTSKSHSTNNKDINLED